ncbi:hypothetical protein M501DRAFT_924553 [Patellaria atrata CBS 101060]|uniref:Cytochrome c oxidase assembly protein COX16, mitochondrial n=1 Tax=Patellaria atrata CBS 101060 TaxID=1346257 RepID=A0A9P4SJ41_9PEZI|nr:hypothetical protein M501DRAFT_924553 [Patellaria atrata CBS 101060]
MPVFQNNPFRPSNPSTPGGVLAAKYRRTLPKHPFLLFGLPFITVMVAGSFFLTPATALRYEKHDRKTRLVTQDEMMGLEKGRRRIDIRDEYYRLAAKDLDNWEQKRVKRLPGEIDGVIE